MAAMPLLSTRTWRLQYGGEPYMSPELSTGIARYPVQSPGTTYHHHEMPIIPLAEEVGVEPTRRFIGASLVLKTKCPTGDIALP